TGRPVRRVRTPTGTAMAAMTVTVMGIPITITIMTTIAHMVMGTAMRTTTRKTRRRMITAAIGMPPTRTMSARPPTTLPAGPGRDDPPRADPQAPAAAAPASRRAPRRERVAALDVARV